MTTMLAMNFAERPGDEMTTFTKLMQAAAIFRFKAILTEISTTLRNLPVSVADTVAPEQYRFHSPGMRIAGETECRPVGLGFTLFR